MGLLSKASSFTEVSKLAFPQFIISHNIKTFAVFELNNNYYKITNSIGFDGSSLLSSLSTKDFWDGVCDKEQKAYTFESENKSLNPMLQFFSFELMEQIKYVSLYRVNNKIFMLCNKEFDQSIINDLQNIDFQKDYIDLDKINKTITKNTKLIKYEIDFAEAVSSFMSLKGKDVDNKEEMKIVLYNELANRFSCFLSQYGTVKTSKNSIKVVITTDKSIENTHLITHIVYNMSKVIGKNSEMISFSNNGVIDSLAAVKSFLKVE